MAILGHFWAALKINWFTVEVWILASLLGHYLNFYKQLEFYVYKIYIATKNFFRWWEILVLGKIQLSN